MKKIRMIIGVLMTLLGIAAFLVPSELFLREGWAVGILLIVSGVLGLIPLFRERAAGKKDQKDPSKKFVKKEQKKSSLPYVISGIEIFVGLIIFLCGVTRTLTSEICVYLISSCVMFFGLFRLSVSSKEKEQREKELAEELAKPEAPLKRKNKKRKKTEVPAETPVKDKKGMEIFCNVTSLVVGAAGICYNFLGSIPIESLIASNIIIYGVNWYVSGRTPKTTKKQKRTP